MSPVISFVGELPAVHAPTAFDVGNTTGGTLAGFQTNVTYYFTLIAHGGMSQESPPSNEVSYTVPTNSPAAQQLSLGPVATGGTNSASRLSFQGYSGTTCQVQSSQDLQHWNTLWTTNCGSDGLIVFEVTDMANYPWRFYRVLRE